MLRLIRREAWAYLQLGLSGEARRAEGAELGDDLAVLFVHGVAGRISQFHQIRSVLERTGAQRFEGFSYRSHRPLRQLGAELGDQLDRLCSSNERVLLVGHSLGGVLGRIALQLEPTRGRRLAGWVSICSPLHGTRRSRFALTPSLRALAPSSELVGWLQSTSDHLRPLLPTTLCVGARRDALVSPTDSAFLDGAERMELVEAAHASSLFDVAVAERVGHLARRLLELPPRRGP